MRIAVTGATGFIGSRFVGAASAAGDEIVSLARRPSDVKGIRFVAWDMAQDAPPVEALAGVDVIAHLAALVPPSMADPAWAASCFAANALGTLRLLQAAEAAGVSRVIATSSANAYRFAEGPVSEDAAIYPSHRAPYYLTSKLAAEVFLMHWAQGEGRHATSLRLSAVYGPGMPEAGLIPAIMQRLRNGEAVRLENVGHYGVDFVAVDDVVFALRAALERPADGPVNVGSGARVLIEDAVEAIRAALGAPALLINYAPPSAKPDRGFSALDIGKARALWGYAPRSFEQGIREMLSCW